MESNKYTFGPGSRGSAPHVYFHCNSLEEGWERFDRWMQKAQNRAQANGRLYQRTKEGWARVERPPATK